MKPIYPTNKDRNQNEIEACLMKMGCEVIDMAAVGDGFPDLLVECRGELCLVEVKNPKTGYGKRGLSKSQRKRATLWQKVKVYVVHTIDDCIEFVRGDRDKLVYKPTADDLSDLSLRGKR